MTARPGRGLVIAGGICAILWVVLSQGFYAIFPLAAGGTMLPLPGGIDAETVRWAELGQRPAVVALEWIWIAVPLLLWPFLLAMQWLLRRHGQGDLALVAVGLGVLCILLTIVSDVTNMTPSHALAQAYVDAVSPAERAATLNTLRGLFFWRWGLNRASGLLYQACVGLIGLGMVLGRVRRGWGWVGLIGAVLAVPAKFDIGLEVPTNAVWTGLAYAIWPVAVAICLLRWRDAAGEPGAGGELASAPQAPSQKEQPGGCPR